MKPWYKSKTVIFNILSTAVPIVGYFAGSPEMLKSYMTPAHFTAYAVAVGAVNQILRAVTTQGISFFGESNEKPTS